MLFWYLFWRTLIGVDRSALRPRLNVAPQTFASECSTVHEVERRRDVAGSFLSPALSYRNALDKPLGRQSEGMPPDVLCLLEILFLQGF